MTVVDAAAPASDVDPRAVRRRRPRLRLAVAAVVLAGALVFLLVEGLGNALDYFDTVHQALAQKSSLGTTTLRLEGVVVRGSIRPTRLGTDFVVGQGSERVVVHNTGSPPGLFQANIPVVVVGHFASASSRLFVSDQIMVKHSANYIAAHPGRVRAPNGTVR
ncbi:MAG TPA: cytochrome c maturation protein CcmE [Acidimicrobiales bacterium]|nr:cytochrome c maturation protein CcmE [Acidimicrobiales bacterium]